MPIESSRGGDQGLHVGTTGPDTRATGGIHLPEAVVLTRRGLEDYAVKGRPQEGLQKLHCVVIMRGTPPPPPPRENHCQAKYLLYQYMMGLQQRRY